MEDSASISEREQGLIDFLVRHQGGWVAQVEIAGAVGVNKSNVRRIAERLQRRGQPIVIAPDGALKIDMARYRTVVRLDLHQSAITFLATRLLARYSDKPNVHAVEALLALGKAMVQQKVAQPIGQHIIRVSEDLRQRQSHKLDEKSDYVRNLEKITEAWAGGTKLLIDYQPLHGRALRAHRFHPYFLEPSAIGYSTYVIGKDETLGELRARKIERITGITTLPMETFEIPSDFDPAKLLGGAWGIWFGTEDKQETVRLRFMGADIVRRVKESMWHPSRKIIRETIDELIWQVELDAPQEMLPWVRGWGSSVEVLEPEDMKEEVMAEIEKMAKIYGLTKGVEKTVTVHRLLWGKTNRPKQTRFHLLICHMIDVGQVALALWRSALTPGIKHSIANALGFEPEEAGRFLAFLAATHDLGKACPAFQSSPSFADIGNYKMQIDAIRSHMPFAHDWQSCQHAYVSTVELQELLVSELGMSRQLADLFARAIGGHHGRWPLPNDIANLEESPSILGEITAGDFRWRDARLALFHDVRHIFEPPPLKVAALGREQASMILTVVAGFVSIADWIGSIAKRFGYRQRLAKDSDLEAYAQKSQEIAERAIRELGWTVWSPPQAFASFSEQFGGKSPRPSQERIIELADGLVEPSLVIIEDATGTGKTESGLYLADHWTQVLGNRGAYIAMPTKATSNQMYLRMSTAIEARYGNQIKPLLVHSQARWTAQNELVTSVGDGDQTQKASYAATNWFADDRKRSLLAPFGVGTVDQTLMSVLQTNHFFVRLFALSRKMVIFDEVHAYDTYMSTIFERLLQWLRIVGASVVILSATLSGALRRKLIEAYGGQEFGMIPKTSYPRVTWITGDKAPQSRLLPQPMQQRPTLLKWVEESPAEIAQQVREQMQKGGCIAVICNRIARAQAVYSAICDLNRSQPWLPEEDIVLFHARFPMVWRDQIEKDTRARFEDKAVNPRKHSVVVATQVIEQSLDLDFDLIISDLAPIDLLIQRIGRLHRHAMRDGYRPENLKDKQFWITKPKHDQSVPSFGYDELVYSRYVLLRSFWEIETLIQNGGLLDLLEKPTGEDITETERLIEAVYPDIPADKTPDWSSFPSEWQLALAEAWQKMAAHDGKDEYDARENLIQKPEEDLLKPRYKTLPDEDDANIHKAMRALTRKQSLPSVQLICLFETAQGLSLDIEDASVISLQGEDKPDDDETRQLIGNSVQVSGWKVWQHFRNVDTPQRWEEHSFLRHFRVAQFAPEAIDNEVRWMCQLNHDVSLELHDKLGIVIHGPARQEDEE